MLRAVSKLSFFWVRTSAGDTGGAVAGGGATRAGVGVTRRATGCGFGFLAARTLIWGNCVPPPLTCGVGVGAGVDGVSPDGGAWGDGEGGVDSCGACVCAGGFVEG